MRINFIILLCATVVPLIIGMIWYHPKVFGNSWMKASGVSPESAGKVNMGLIFGLTALFSFFIAFMMQFVVIHQMSVEAFLTQQADFTSSDSRTPGILAKIKELYWNTYRTFKHGAFHGTLAGLFLATPIVATNALYERKSFRYIAINGGYWIVSLALMGGVICAFS